MGGPLLTPAEKALYTEGVRPSLDTLATAHDVQHLLVMGLEKNALLPADAGPLHKDILDAVYRYEQRRHEREVLCSALEAAGVPFMPLKGAIISEYYPEPWMRTSCDIDILIHEEDVDRAVVYLEAHCHYTLTGRGTHDVALTSPGQILLELHFTLVEKGLANAASTVLETVWEVATCKAGYRYWYELPDDMFYYYHVAHMAKHFELGGCGVRPLIDLWILDGLENADRSGRDSLLRRGNLLVFAQAARQLSRVWMDAAPHTSLTQRMEDYIFRGGMYGANANRVAIQQHRRGGRVKFLLSRIFASYEKLVEYYPILEKRRWLMPVMQVRRWLMLCRPHVAHLAKTEIRLNYMRSQATVADMGALMKEIGLQ